MRFLYNPLTSEFNAAPPREVIYSDTAPVNPPFGARWANTTNLREYLYINSAWVEVGVGPAGAPTPAGTGVVVVDNGVAGVPVSYGNINTANAIVRRDASGNFSAGTITADLTGNASSATKLATPRAINVSGDVTGTAQNFDGSAAITISTEITAGTIVNADINAAAAIVDTKLATISTSGKVSNSATTATNLNTASAIVARDASGNFSAGTITAGLTGNASSATKLATARTLSLSGAVTGSVSFDGTGDVSIATTFIKGNWTGKTSAYTAVDGDRIGADTRVSAFTITLPASPAQFTEIVVADPYGTWETRNLTIGRNGQTIDNLAEDLVCNVSGAQFTIRYQGTTWEIY